MRQQVKCQLDHKNVELTLSRLSQLFEGWLLFYIERIVSLMKMIVFNSIQVINYWFTLYCALRFLYQQAQTSSPTIWGISDQDVTESQADLLFLQCFYWVSNSIIKSYSFRCCWTHNAHHLWWFKVVCYSYWWLHKVYLNVFHENQRWDG